MIFDKYKLINIAIPRTSSSFIFCRLAGVEYSEKNRAANYVEGVKEYLEIGPQNLLPYYQHGHFKYINYEREILCRPKYADYKVFTFIKCPYKRVLSIFSYLGLPKGNFQRFCKEMKSRFSIQGWTPQTHYCMNMKGDINLDFIGRIEDIRVEWARLQRDICPSMPDYTSKQYGKKNEFSLELYDSESQEIIYNIYKEDFDAFGYNKEINL